MDRTLRCVISGGGTGGHISPGLAIAQVLRETGHRVMWLGAQGGLEEKLLSSSEYPVVLLPMSGLRGGGVLQRFRAIGQGIHACGQSLWYLHHWKADCVVAMGGFAAGPAALAAWILGIPVFVQEQNTVMGLTNRCMSRIAKRVFLGFPLWNRKLSSHFEVTGNPVLAALRSTIASPKERFAERDHQKELRILVLGGSRGADFINTRLPVIWGRWKTNFPNRPLKVWHQTGGDAQRVDAVRATYAVLGISAEVQSFIHPISEAYAWADFVCARSGALTVSELMAVGLGALLIPYPHAVDNHQVHNAAILQGKKGAFSVEESQWDDEQVVKQLQTLAEPGACLEMAVAAWDSAWYNPANRIVETIEKSV